MRYTYDTLTIEADCEAIGVWDLRIEEALNEHAVMHAVFLAEEARAWGEVKKSGEGAAGSFNQMGEPYCKV